MFFICVPNKKIIATSLWLYETRFLVGERHNTGRGLHGESGTEGDVLQTQPLRGGAQGTVHTHGSPILHCGSGRIYSGFLPTLWMPIRIRLFILIPIRFRIPSQIFTQVWKSESFYFYSHQCQFTLFYLARHSHRCHNFQYFGQNLENFLEKSIL